LALNCQEFVDKSVECSCKVCNVNDERGYLRIGVLAERTGVSPEVLRAWEQRYDLLRPSRSAGGFRLYSDDDVRRVQRTTDLIASGLSTGEAARQALEADISAAPPVDGLLVEDLAGRLREALDAMDAEVAHLAFDRLLASVSIATVLGEVVLPYLRELGDRWAAGEVSVAQEHFASNLIRGRLLGLARDWGSGEGPNVLLACPRGGTRPRADRLWDRSRAPRVARDLPRGRHPDSDDRGDRASAAARARRPRSGRPARALEKRRRSDRLSLSHRSPSVGA
jgi:DNA-binding transcriptional MerR regulator